MSEPYWSALAGGASVDYEGAWGAGTAYLPGDVVVYNGINYLAVNPSTGVTPGTAIPIVPAGALMPFAGAAAPDGWLFCDGAAVSRTTYAGLFAAISTAYGVGDGSTTFNLPDLRGRIPVGKGTHANVDALNDNDGAALADRQPKHRHTVTDPTHSHGLRMNTSAGGGFNTAKTIAGLAQDTTSTPTELAGTGISIAAAGATAPLDTPAYVVVNYLVKT